MTVNGRRGKTRQTRTSDDDDPSCQVGDLVHGKRRRRRPDGPDGPRDVGQRVEHAEGPNAGCGLLLGGEMSWDGWRGPTTHLYPRSAPMPATNPSARQASRSTRTLRSTNFMRLVFSGERRVAPYEHVWPPSGSVVCLNTGDSEQRVGWISRKACLPHSIGIHWIHAP